MHPSPPASCILAPTPWQVVDFVSDLHLQQRDATWCVFADYLQCTPADAVFLLGDIFEIWVGDDALQDESHAFEREVVSALWSSSQRGVTLHFMHGNRDFLAGQVLCDACGMALLHDPCVLELPQEAGRTQRILLSHGDALCIDDTQYMQFRNMVRNPAWQQLFLQKLLPERMQLARHLRQQSEARKSALGVEGYADVDAPLALQWLVQHGCNTLVHGHTHQPADHVLDDSPPCARQRKVLSDWHALAAPPRAQVLRLRLPEMQWERIDLVATPRKS